MANTLQDTITIKFEAKDQGLLNAIKSLDSATKSLLNSQAKLVDKQRKGETTRDKHKKQIASLIIGVKALGGQWSKNATLLKLHKKALTGDKIAMQKLKNATIAYTASLKHTSRGLLDTSHSTRILGGSFAVLRSKLLLVSFAATTFSMTLGKIFSLYGRQEKAEKKLSQVLKSTANAVNMSHKELTLMASGLQSVTTFGDEAIIEMQALLLTFTQIGDTVFPQAVETVLNLSEAMGQDLKTSAIQVGKALNEPVKGISALRRVGIQLTEDQETQIKRFVSLNDVASAQAIIIKELEVQFGGMARAVRGTVIGSFNALSNSFGDMMEKLGEKLAPFMQALAESLQSVTFLLQSEGERQIAFLQSIGASEETLTKARIGLLKEEIQERLRSIGITDLDLNQRDKLVDKYLKQETHLNELKDALSSQKESLEKSGSALLDATGSSAEFNKALERSNIVVKEASNKGTKYSHVTATLVERDKGATNQLALKLLQQKADVAQTQSQLDAQQLLTIALREYLISLGLVTKAETENKNSRKENLEETLLAGQMLMASFSGVTGAHKNAISEREKAELDSLRNTDKYKGASGDRQEAMEKRITQTFADEKLKIWKMEKAASITSIIMDTAGGVMKAMDQLGVFGIPVATLIGGMGAVQLNIVASQPAPTFEQGGLVGGRRHSQGGTMIEAEQGEFVMSRKAVNSIGTSALNQMNQGGGGGITLNISAPLVDETVIDSIIPAIQKAQRMNLA